jgi:hypothetical protein
MCYIHICTKKVIFNHLNCKHTEFSVYLHFVATVMAFQFDFFSLYKNREKW